MWKTEAQFNSIKLCSLAETAISPGASAAERSHAFDEIVENYKRVALGVLRRMLLPNKASLGIEGMELPVLAMEAVYYAVKKLKPEMADKFPGLVKYEALAIVRDISRKSRIISIPQYVLDLISGPDLSPESTNNSNLTSAIKAMTCLAEDEGHNVPRPSTESMFEPEEILLFFELAGLISEDQRILLEEKHLADPNSNYLELRRAIAENRGVSEQTLEKQRKDAAKLVSLNLDLLDLLSMPKGTQENSCLGTLCSFLLHQYLFDPKKTIALTERILKGHEGQEPEDVNAANELRITLAIMYRRSKHPDKAEAILIKPLRDEKHRAEALSQLGEIAYNRRSLDTAYRHFLQAFQLDSTTSGRKTSLGKTCLAMRLYDEAIGYLEAERQVSPNDTVPQFLLAKAYFKSARYELFEETKRDTYEKALGLINDLLLTEPNDYRNHLLRTDILVKLHKIEEAKVSLAQAQQHSIRRPKILRRFAHIAFLEKDYPMAIHYAEQAYSLDPRNEHLEHFLRSMIARCKDKV